MAITLTSAFQAALKSGENRPCVILEVALDSGTIKWGTHTGGFTDVAPIVKSASSLQNKLDPKEGYATRGKLSVTIVGRENFRALIAGNYLKNRRVTRKDGFVGLAYTDYASTYSGKITDWSRKGDELTLAVEDEMVDTTKTVPVENSTNTQYLIYSNTNPVDIMTNLLITQLGVDSGLVDSSRFTSERDLWLNGWKFDRVLTEPKEAKGYLNELQEETNSFLFHDGEKISFKVFAPPVPGQTIEEWTDASHIIDGSLSCKSGYKDHFFNRVVVYYDHDESGGDNAENFESAVIAADAASQGAGQWNEVATRAIKSKWLRSSTFSSPAGMNGLIVYHASRNNGTGSGTIAYTASTKSLTWTPPGGSAGEAVNITKDGKYQLYGSDKTKYIRVLIIYDDLPGSDQNVTLNITALTAQQWASQLAQKILSHYRNPVSTVTFSVDINACSWANGFLKPTDIKDLTTDEAAEYGDSTWTKERMMLTSIRPDFGKGVVEVGAIETKMYRKYGFIAPAGYPDYGSATDAQKEYAFIRTTDPQYHIW